MAALSMVGEEISAAGCSLLLIVVSPAIAGSILTRHGDPEQKDRWAARIVRVTDGDTVVVRSGSGRRFRVRLIGIDTPASTSMKRLAPRGRRVRVKGDPTQDRRDSFGRLLAYVKTRGGPQLNIAQVRRGWAKVYVFQGNPFRQTSSFRRVPPEVPSAPSVACGASATGTSCGQRLNTDPPAPVEK